LPKKNKALFLDRDGVINKDYGYVYQINKFDLIDNIKILIKAAKAKGYKIIVVTNQAGIGRGFFSEDDFENLNNYMKDLFLKDKCDIDAVYYCPYHSIAGVGKYLKDSYDRKPNPGMLLKARKKFNLDMNKSILIGDKISDIEAGIKSSVKTNILFNNKEDNIQNINKNYKFIEINCLTEALKYF
jgi:D-glycero-D-manno-heptose 1,7-bisphosphate phosphatase